MRQLLVRALWLLRRPAVALAFLLLAVGASALVFVPLFGVPGYELSEALALAAGLLCGVFGIAAAFLERRLITARDPRPQGALRYDNPITAAGLSLAASALLGCVALLPPLLTALLRSLWATQCDPLANVGFFPMLTVPSVLMASAAGVFCGFAGRRWWVAGGLYVVIVAATGVLTAWPLYFGPQVYAFNHFLGYFPGPLYDEALTLRAPVYWFRLQTVLLAGAVWLLTAFTLNMKEGRILRPHFRPAAAVLLGLLVFAAASIEAQGPVLGLRMSAGFLESKLGGLRVTPHFRLVYFRGKPKEELDRLERDLEFRYLQLEQFLGAGPKEPIHVFLYRSAEEKQQLVGAGGTQFAKPWLLQLHINDAPFPHPVMKHELMHVMAAPFGTGPFRTAARFGLFPEMAVVEGLAVAGDNRLDDLTLHQWAAAMRQKGLAPDVVKLFGPGGFYAASASRAYTLAGSFLRYLGDTYGTEKLRALYASGDFSSAYGQDLRALAAGYQAFLDTVPLDARAMAQAEQRFRRPSLFARSCAREVATLEDDARQFLYSDPEEALRLYQRCAKLQPEEPNFKLGEAAALAQLDRKPEAQELLARLASTLSDAPSVEADVAMARGDLAWKMERLDVAKEQFERVLALQAGPAQDRTARVKLAALQSPDSGPAIRAYFEDKADEVKLFVLGEAARASPEDENLHYLIGRRLTQLDAPKLALPHLAKALASAGLPETIRKEALRLRMEALYRAGDCATVEKEAQAVPDLGLAFVESQKEWAARCAFEARAYNGALVPEGPLQ